MKVIVCGLGSMGKRRIRLLKSFNPKIEIFGVDKNEERALSVSKEFNIQTYNSIEEANKENHIECIFVCSSPLSHYEIIKTSLMLGLNVFTEINVVSDGYEELLSIAKEKNLKLFLSSTMNYRDDINYIINRVKENNQPLSYFFHVGQYLPDWHPWENFKNFFVSNKRTNGCREILAIQMPWIERCFGEIEKVKSIRASISSLPLNYPDSIMILIKHKNGNIGSFFVDVVARKPITDLTIEGNDLLIKWEGTSDNLREYNFQKKSLENIVIYKNTTHVNNYSHLIIEEPYLEEIKCFFDFVNYNKLPIYTFEKDKLILDWIDKIEEL